MLRVQCPKCGKSLKVPPELAGRRVGCPRCRTPFAVAAPEEPEAAPHAGMKGFFVTLLLVALLAGGAAGWMAWTGKGPFARPPASGPAVALNPSPSTQPVATAATTPPTNPSPVKHRGTEDGVPDTPRTETRSAGGQRYALLVGVQQYDSKELPDLNYSEADVEALAEVLRVSGYPAANVALLTGKGGARDPQRRPTAERIRAELDALLQKCGKDDLVLVAFAGHGIELKETKKYYFCPLGAKFAEPQTLVSLNEIYDKLKGCAAGYKLLLADACRNDPGARGPRIIPEEANVPSVTRPQFAAPPGGVMAFYSCSASQYAYEPEDLQHGVFFHFLIEGLKGQADLDGDGEVIREELEAFVKKRVRSYTAEKLKREQWPHLLGESNDQRPLVKLPGSPKPPPERPKVTRKELTSPMFISEDFKKAPRGKTPAGWKGRDLYAVFEEGDNPSLRPTGKVGVFAPLTLPDTPLAGDFFVECDFRLGHSNDEHRLLMRLEGMGVAVPLTIDWAGSVTLADRPTESFPDFNPQEVNRIRIVREGRNYRVSVNEKVLVDVPLAYAGNFDRAHLYLSAGKGASDYARLLAVRAGLLAGLGEGPRTPPRAGKVVLEEDFSRVEVGTAPKGWDGKDVVLVQREDAARPGLEANEDKGSHPITLPPFSLPGDCFVECEFLLGHSNDEHVLNLRLDGKDGSLPLKVDWNGDVTLADRPTRRAAGTFTPTVPNRVRLVREGRRYRVSINDVDVPGLAFPLAGLGEFSRLEIGLSAGSGSGERMKIYSVRIGTLEAPAAENPKPDGAKQVIPEGSGS